MSEVKTMLNFDEEKVRSDHQNGVDLIPAAEAIVDEICNQGYSIFSW